MRSILAILIALSLSCAADDTNTTVQMHGSLTIFSPLSDSSLDGNPFVDYDYFLDCPDKECRIGKMRYGQYIVLNIPAGDHTIFLKTSDEGAANAMLLAGRYDKEEIKIVIAKDKQHYIIHDWNRSFGRHLLKPLSVPLSSMRELGEFVGADQLKEILAIHEAKKWGFHTYGTEGIKYDLKKN